MGYETVLERLWVELPANFGGGAMYKHTSAMAASCDAKCKSRGNLNVDLAVIHILTPTNARLNPLGAGNPGCARKALVIELQMGFWHWAGKTSIHRR